jgi:hypothetical protein
MFLQSAGGSRTKLDLQSPEEEERVVELLKFMERSCYATNTMRQPVEVVPHLILNGRQVSVNVGS